MNRYEEEVNPQLIVWSIGGLLVFIAIMMLFVEHKKYADVDLSQSRVKIKVEKAREKAAEREANSREFEARRKDNGIEFLPLSLNREPEALDLNRLNSGHHGEHYALPPVHEVRYTKQDIEARKAKWDAEAVSQASDALKNDDTIEDEAIPMHFKMITVTKPSTEVGEDGLPMYPHPKAVANVMRRAHDRMREKCYPKSGYMDMKAGMRKDGHVVYLKASGSLRGDDTETCIFEVLSESKFPKFGSPYLIQVTYRFEF